ncbi:hypothetical protein MHBO_001007 [Bonamia ostreae]|uniref:Myosin motor domain-containing protein n=1 Tax=Bonamia ostreae TaxID=126728 RepID=A0ABV2AHG7_9EUKA
MLVTVNPYKNLPLMGDEMVEMYRKLKFAETGKPHIYNIASRALKGLALNGKNQSIIIRFSLVLIQVAIPAPGRPNPQSTLFCTFQKYPKATEMWKVKFSAVFRYWKRLETQKFFVRPKRRTKIAIRVGSGNGWRFSSRSIGRSASKARRSQNICWKRRELCGRLQAKRTSTFSICCRLFSRSANAKIWV